MPAIANTTNFPNDTTLRGIHMICYQAWAQRDPVGRNLFNVYDSTQYREHALTFGGLGLMDTKVEGDTINYDAPVEGFLETFTHVVYAKGVRITMEQWSDDLYGIMEDSPAELGRMAYATEETILANHFNNGFNSSYAGADGKELFATDHVRENGDTYKNELSTAADLAATSLEQALIDFRGFKDGGGTRLQIKPETLLVAPDDQFTAAKILDSTNSPTVNYGGSGFGDSAVNPINGLGLSMQVWDYLTYGNGAWFLLAEKSDHKLTLYEREPFSTSDVYDFDTGDLKFRGWFRQSSGWADPRGVFGTPGAA